MKLGAVLSYKFSIPYVGLLLDLDTPDRVPLGVLHK